MISTVRLPARFFMMQYRRMSVPAAASFLPVYFGISPILYHMDGGLSSTFFSLLLLTKSRISERFLPDDVIFYPINLVNLSFF